MSSPGPAEVVVVRPEAVTALADELTALATELSDDADRCRAGAASLSGALEGDEGWAAGAAATAWAGLEEVLAERTASLAETLTGAVRAYVAEDEWLAATIDHSRTRAPR
jgi:hypothetical protein